MRLRSSWLSMSDSASVSAPASTSHRLDRVCKAGDEADGAAEAAGAPLSSSAERSLKTGRWISTLLVLAASMPLAMALIKMMVLNTRDGARAIIEGRGLTELDVSR